MLNITVGTPPQYADLGINGKKPDNNPTATSCNKKIIIKSSLQDLI